MLRRVPQFFIVIFSLLWLSLLLIPGAAQETVSTAAGEDGYTRALRLGIAHIGSAEIPADDTRYQKALVLGAGWTRYPIYWYRVEQQPGSYTWDDYDRVVAADIAHGLNTNAVLMGIPEFYQDDETVMTGLMEPVFADGSDVPRDNKTINPANPWATYVYEVVQRYKPGGALSSLQNWSADKGIRVWEIWNEPDLPMFWQGNFRQYARLLKVAYLAAHHADSSAVVMMGGLLYNTRENWLARVLAIYSTEGFAAQNNFYMDAVAVHSYGYPWRSGWLVVMARETLQAYKLRRPVWLNETGVPVWDDYPGPVWAKSPAERARSATADQQAWYLIQSAAYAWAQGADKVFYHQLFDDCGDQPPGTNFPPHGGELCVNGAICFGSAFGLYRNETTSVCYSQHPFPGSARPAARAFRLLADVFGNGDFGRGEIELINGVTIIRLERPTSSERIHVIWNRRFEANTWQLQATGLAARLYTLDGTADIQPDDKGNYSVDLQPAQPDNYPALERGDISAIGGPPVILVERFAEGSFPPLSPGALQIVPASGPPTTVPAVTPLTTPLPVTPAAPLSVTPAAPLSVTPLSPVQPPAASFPTVSPEEDISFPVTHIEPLPEVSPATFLVKWSASDDGGIERYVIWVKINEGDWLPWLETARTEAYYIGQAGNTYSFAAWAVDQGGNWSQNVELVPQAATRIE